MSHFPALVLVRGSVSRRHAENIIEPLLAPYDENLELPEYEADCSCVGFAAQIAAMGAMRSTDAEARALREQREQLAQEVLDASHGELDKATVSSAENPAELLSDSAPGKQALIARAQALNAAFADMTARAQQAQREAAQAHPMYGKPDPDCSDCHGSGRHMTTANHAGRWDWWVIGGRWTGVLTPDYDPSHDVRNYEPCNLCAGHRGKRYWRRETATVQPVLPDGSPDNLRWHYNDADGLYEHWTETTPDHPDAVVRDCTGCEGTGTRRTFSSAEHGGDVLPLAQLPEDFYKMFRVLVTPDGTWHEMGRVGWWGMSHDDMPVAEWQEKVKALVASADTPDGLTAVVVDCHT